MVLLQKRTCISTDVHGTLLINLNVVDLMLPLYPFYCSTPFHHVTLARLPPLPSYQKQVESLRSEYAASKEKCEDLESRIAALSGQAEAAALEAAATVSSLENDLNLSRKDAEVQEQERQDYRAEVEVRGFETAVSS